MCILIRFEETLQLNFSFLHSFPSSGSRKVVFSSEEILIQVQHSIEAARQFKSTGRSARESIGNLNNFVTDKLSNFCTVQSEQIFHDTRGIIAEPRRAGLSMNPFAIDDRRIHNRPEQLA